MKRILAFLLISTLLFTACCCSNKTAVISPNPSESSNAPKETTTQSVSLSPEPSNAPVSYNEDVFTKNSDGTISLKDIDLNTDDPSILKKDTVLSESDNSIDIPVYNPDYITYGSCGGFFPCIDHGMWNSFSVYSDYLMYVQTVYPSNA